MSAWKKFVATVSISAALVVGALTVAFAQDSGGYSPDGQTQQSGSTTNSASGVIEFGVSTDLNGGWSITGGGRVETANGESFGGTVEMSSVGQKDDDEWLLSLFVDAFVPLGGDDDAAIKGSMSFNTDHGATGASVGVVKGFAPEQKGSDKKDGDGKGEHNGTSGGKSPSEPKPQDEPKEQGSKPKPTPSGGGSSKGGGSTDCKKTKKGCSGMSTPEGDGSGSDSNHGGGRSPSRCMFGCPSFGPSKSGGSSGPSGPRTGGVGRPPSSNPNPEDSRGGHGQGQSSGGRASGVRNPSVINPNPNRETRKAGFNLNPSLLKPVLVNPKPQQ